MIAELKPYDSYRDSGLPWLGLVPAHWQVKRAKSVLTAIDQRSKTGTEELLTVSSARGVVPRSSAKVTMFKAKSYAGYKLCWPGDLAINSLWAWGGGLGVSKHHGIISTAYGVYRVRPDAEYNPRYLDALVRSQPFNWELKLRSKGIWISRLQLTDESFLNSPLPILPPDEQELIVRFLDWASVRLGKAIAAKRKVIGLLEEQKQAIIHRAVTRGLDDTVPLKPSGLDWLGDVPEHWEVWRVSRFAKVGNGSTPSRAKPLYWLNGRFPWLNSSQVNRGSIDSANQFVTKLALRECHLPVVKPGSLLVAITGQGKTRGTAAILRVEATINQHVAYITPRIPIVNIEFLQLEFVAAYNELRRLSEDSGSTKGALTCEDLKRFKVCLPPVGEQATIVQDVEMQTKSVSSQVDVITREIQLLQEYRTRLIADVVTGKLDVRDFARTLPADIADEAAELASSELGDDELSESDDELADELAGEPA